MSRTEVAERPPEKSHADEGDCANCGHAGWLHYAGPKGLCVAATDGPGNSCDKRCPGWHSGRVKAELK
jgi:hypothetical protein